MYKEKVFIIQNKLFIPFTVVIWWIVLFILGFIALSLIPFTVSFSNYSLQEKIEQPVWIERWSNFDGGAYLIISEAGYREMGLLQAYFPGYPILIDKAFDLTWPILKQFEVLDPENRLLTGLAVSFVCSILFFAYLNLYLSSRFDIRIRTAIFFTFLIFPTSFYLHALYTESFFLLLLVYSLYAYQQKWWIRLSIALMVLTATRVVGVFLIPALMMDLYFLEKKKAFSVVSNITFFKENYKKLFAISIGSVGLLSFMFYLHRVFNDALMFFHVQSSFGAGRQQTIVLFPQVVWRYMKIFWTARPFDWKYYAYVQEFSVTWVVLIFLCIAFTFRKRYKITLAELIFSFGAFFLPTLTGNFSSMPRYVLVCLPLFILIGQYIYRHKLARILYIGLCVLLSIINIILFIQGHWVA